MIYGGDIQEVQLGDKLLFKEGRLSGVRQGALFVDRQQPWYPGVRSWDGLVSLLGSLALAVLGRRPCKGSI